MNKLIIIGLLIAVASCVSVKSQAENSLQISNQDLFENVWHQIDSDKDGQINLIEFAQAYRQIAHELNQTPPSIKLIALTFAQLDTDHETIIEKRDFDEFFGRTQGRTPLNQQSFIQSFLTESDGEQVATETDGEAADLTPWWLKWMDWFKSGSNKEKEDETAQEKPAEGETTAEKPAEGEAAAATATEEKKFLLTKNRKLKDSSAEESESLFDTVGDGFKELDPTDGESFIGGLFSGNQNPGPNGNGTGNGNATGNGNGNGQGKDNSEKPKLVQGEQDPNIFEQTGDALNEINPFDGESAVGGLFSGDKKPKLVQGEQDPNIFEQTGDALNEINPFDGESAVGGLFSGDKKPKLVQGEQDPNIFEQTGDALNEINPFDGESAVGGLFSGDKQSSLAKKQDSNLVQKDLIEDINVFDGESLISQTFSGENLVKVQNTNKGIFDGWFGDGESDSETPSESSASDGENWLASSGNKIKSFFSGLFSGSDEESDGEQPPAQGNPAVENTETKESGLTFQDSSKNPENTINQF